MNENQRNCLNNIKVIMVETSHPGNIGAAARALKTMGLSKLVLVSPQNFPADKAVWRAAGAVDVLDQVEVFDDFKESIADCALVIGASARQRKIPWPLLNPRVAAEKLIATASGASDSETEGGGNTVALVFGREDRGLTNEELQSCNYHVTIPGNEEYSVLNIAAAIQVLCYELRVVYNSQGTEEYADKIAEDRWDEDFASQGKIEYFFEHLEKVLIKLDFHDEENPRQLMTRLRRLFNRNRLDKMELNILRGILTAIDKRVP